MGKKQFERKNVKVSPAVKIDRKNETLIIALLDVESKIVLKDVAIPLDAIPNLQSHLTAAYGAAMRPNKKMIQPVTIMPN